MKQGLKKLPAPLRKQALLRFAGAGACFLLLCGMALGTGQAGLCLPFFVLGIFLAGTGAGLVRLSCQGKILTLETVCQEVEKTWFRRRAKALVLRCGERTLRVYLRGRRDRVSPGSRVQLFLAESTPVYEEEGVLVLGEYLLTAVSSPLTILTGGPGTGKTMTQKALVSLYHRVYPGKTVACCAPTGRAARRMEESTGVKAATIHKALKLLAGEDGVFSEPEPLDADLVLVDEVSMLDVYLAESLFRALKPGCQLVLVGDADQLPSVGPGAVLRELLSCGQIPVVRLTKIYRQSADSPIPINAALIRAGNLHLEYGKDFQFVECADMACSAGMMEELYLREAGRFGVDNVALLSPFRKKTETGVNALNPKLREWINPKAPDKPEISHGKRLFRLGDKVMQVRNFQDISNGDIGYVAAVENREDGPVLKVDFGEDRVMEYDGSQLDLLDLAYATTIHKSQGSEYDSVIISVQCAHSVMLNRPLLYTAVTRAKKRVILVGERKALCAAIRRTDTEHRNTQLARRILDQLEQLREE